MSGLTKMAAVCLALLLPSLLPAAELSVMFRYDDCSARSDIEAELALLEVFRSHGARVTFALTPIVCAGDGYSTAPQPELPYPSERAEALSPFLRDSTLELALHGLRHQNGLSGGHPWRSDFVGVGYSEFFGLDREAQAEKITRGADYLESAFGARPRIFVPPWNSYDRSTVSALEGCGLSCLSAGTRGEAPEGSSLAFLPATCDNLGRLREVVRLWQSQGSPEAALVVMLHASLFDGSRARTDSVLTDVNSTLGWLSGQKSVRVLCLGQALSTGPKYTVERFRRYNLYRKVWLAVPRVLSPLPPELYLENPELARLIVLGVAVCAAPLLALALVTGWLVRRRRLRRRDRGDA
ncbi:DUF2334 domain-containing protein [bacterium]|nr:DUF2334 domain-containing protein [bacterium]